MMKKKCKYDNVDKFKCCCYEKAILMLCSIILGIAVIEYALSINLSSDNFIHQLMKYKEDHHKSQSNEEVFNRAYIKWLYYFYSKNYNMNISHIRNQDQYTGHKVVLNIW